MPGFKVSTQPPNSTVAVPHEVAEESYHYWTTVARYRHVDSCAMLSMEDGETGFRWSWRLNTGSFVCCVVGDHGHAFGSFQHQRPRIVELRRPLPGGCGIDLFLTAEPDPTKGAVTHWQNLEAAHFEINHIPGYRDIGVKLTSLTSPQEKVAYLVKHFEQSADQENDIRKRLHEFDYWNTYFGRFLGGRHA